MCLKDKIDFGRAGFYMGYLAGLRYARQLIWTADNSKLDRQAREVLETLDSFLETEEEVAIQQFTGQVYTTEFEEFDLQRYVSRIIEKKAGAVEATSQ